VSAPYPTPHFSTFAVPVTRPIESQKVTTFPETVLLPVTFPDESRYVVEPDDDVDDIPLIRPWDSLEIVEVLMF
jgi:hypothetical protein